MSNADDTLKKIFTYSPVADGPVTELYSPDIPKPEKPPVMPIPDENVQQTEARRRQARASTTGRQSTILTGLGG